MGVYTEENDRYSGIEGSREECHDLNREKIEEIEIQSLLFFRFNVRDEIVAYIYI